MPICLRLKFDSRAAGDDQDAALIGQPDGRIDKHVRFLEGLFLTRGGVEKIQCGQGGLIGNQIPSQQSTFHRETTLASSSGYLAWKGIFRRSRPRWR